MKRSTLFFVAPRQVEMRDETLPPGRPGQVLVRALASAISAGTEMLIYRGEAPAELPADAVIPALAGPLAFPLSYGYSLVGEVIEAGPDVDPAWVGRRVFIFHPHQSHCWADVTALHPLPAGIETEDAVFLPAIETAINFLHDGAPLIGEQVTVFGQGIVGLLTTALLARLLLTRLITLDQHPLRRRWSQALGAHISLAPNTDLRPHLEAEGADLVYELSGAPAALSQAIAAAGFGGRVVIGSWYGRKQVELDLGGAFHRRRIRLVGSQVSTLAPELRGRWDKARRLALAWQVLAELHPTRLISHRFPFAQADAAYALCDRQPESSLQIVLDWSAESHSPERTPRGATDS
jgi:2-desacetyl-2-hydroxyethyl bacteriochlorophyllide A dehydrogenase